MFHKIPICINFKNTNNFIENKFLAKIKFFLDMLEKFGKSLAFRFDVFWPKW